MENIDNTPATLESVWALIKELALSFNRQMAESRAEFDRRMKKQEELAGLRESEMAESRAEFDRRMKKQEELAGLRESEMSESRAEFDRRMKKQEELAGLRESEMSESRAEFDRRMKKQEELAGLRESEMSESRAEFDRRMKKQEELAGSWGNNLGSFAEEYFFNSFENGKQDFFGEKYDSIRRNVPAGLEGNKDEYDIVLVNGKSVAIVEVKFKAHENDLTKIVTKAKTFRTNYPKYENHKIYLGLASMAFYPKLEDECIKEGIAIVKQMGDSVVINDEHLKAF